jgi:Uma2 family endonuclease
MGRPGDLQITRMDLAYNWIGNIMPVALTESPVSVEIPRKRWTREEYHALEYCDVLQYQRLELVEGELISKMGKKRPHVTSLTQMQKLLVAIFGFEFVNPEAPIDVSPEDNPTNEPEPDLIVLAGDPAQLASANPRPRDLRLVVEIADTTLSFDLKTKAALYARAGVLDYWVLDVVGRRMIVHRDPRNGRYHSVVAYSIDESVAPLAAPDSPIRIQDAFLT